MLWTAAIGFFTHALLLPPMLWRNEAGFAAYSQRVAERLVDEPAARVGTGWRTAYTPGFANLLEPLQGHR